ncbi:MAG: hypothetical protein WCI54_07960 [Bacteroidia bacterium]|jgi:hypothetical protein
MKTKLITLIILGVFAVTFVFSQEKNLEVKLPKLSVEQKWETAEGNLVYFIISGISYSKSKGETPEDFGAWTGQVGCPYWKGIANMTPAKFVQEISSNKQQFKDFQMEILSAEKSVVKGRMMGYGNKLVTMYNLGGVTEDDYVRFFKKKWETIAGCVGYQYKQEKKGDWTYFTVSEKK